MEPFKNGINPAALERIASALTTAWPAFPRARFLRAAREGLDTLELKQRVHHVIEALRATLPADFREQAAILGRVRDHWDAGNSADPLRGFAAWPVIDLVAVTGIDHPDLALDTLRRLTPMFSAEFAIRPFLAADWARCAKHLLRWTEDEDKHVRRLASEGSRPRLPWGMRLAHLVRDPRPTLPLLERLRDDPEDYVRRSVANHLNDIGKDHPELVVEICGRWARKAPPGRAWIIRHATRSLVKAGHTGAMALHGAEAGAKVRVERFASAEKSITVGGRQTLSFALASDSSKPQRLILDFAVHYRKADGSARPKVFKWAVVELAPGERIERNKTLSFKMITTRRFYPGMHRVELLVNGRAVAETDFRLRAGVDSPD